MIYFFVGSDSKAKDRNIADLKKKLFRKKDSIRFDYDLLHAFMLKPEELKKSLVSLPAFAKKRLVIIRESQKLKAQHKDIITDVFGSPEHPCILILDYDQSGPDGSFKQKLGDNGKFFDFQRGKDENVFDLATAISRHKKIEALKLLNKLISDGDHPLKIIGGLVWSWGRSRNRISAAKFKQGLLAFQEADLNIKRSRLKPEHAVEVLVVKLCSL